VDTSQVLVEMVEIQKIHQVLQLLEALLFQHQFVRNQQQMDVSQQEAELVVLGMELLRPQSEELLE
jgi:hypothetical protein